MLSSGWTSADSMSLKRLQVSRRWQAMFSAGDIAPIMPLIRRVRRYLEYGSEENKAETLNAISTAFVHAYQQEREAIINNTILGKVKLNLDTFLQQGYAMLGPEIHGATYREIGSVKVDVEFLVYGFDEKNTAHLFIVRDPGEVRSLDIEGFGTIGSGWLLAYASLLSRPLPLHRKGEMIYRLCEAKFLAEKAQGVGRETTVSCVDNPKAPDAPAVERYLDILTIERVREEWNKDHARTLPLNALVGIEQALIGSVSIEQMMETMNCMRLARQ